MRPISSNLRFRPVRAVWPDLTADRRDGVGRPTIADALDAQARDTARRFRRRAVDEAQQSPAHVVESTQTLLKRAVMTAGASGTDIETVCAEHDIAAERDTQAALPAMIGRQLEHDWRGLARVIEQPFTAALLAWRAVFLALEGGTGPCGHAA